MFQKVIAARPIRSVTIAIAAASRMIYYRGEQRGMPVMAYSPLGGSSLVHDPTLSQIGVAHGCSATAVALAWVIRSGKVIAISESSSPAHVKDNAVALSLTLTPQQLQILDAAYPLRSADVLRSLLDRSKRWLRSFRNTQ